MGDLMEEIDRAKKILDDAIAEYQPVAIFSGFSGGYDSLVTTHFATGHESSIRPLHINTGIGIERTREFVRQTCGEFGWGLREEKTAFDYEDLVLGRVKGYAGGFPGPRMHMFMYNRLKERPLRVVVREAKQGQSRLSRVLIVSGIRGDESRIRSGYKRAVSKVGSQVWVNPFYYASADHFREYRKVFSLPSNPVKDALGMSGECLCGAYAHAGELTRVRAACPATADRLEAIERKVRDAGFPWGYEDCGPPDWYHKAAMGEVFVGSHPGLPDDVGPMCHSCEKYAAFDPADIRYTPVFEGGLHVGGVLVNASFTRKASHEEDVPQGREEVLDQEVRDEGRQEGRLDVQEGHEALLRVAPGGTEPSPAPPAGVNSMEEKPRKKRQPKAAKPPPEPWVLLIIDPRSLGAAIRMVPREDLGQEFSMKPHRAQRFATEAKAKRYAKLIDGPRYIYIPAMLQEAPKAIKKPSGTRQKLLRYMESDDV